VFRKDDAIALFETVHRQAVVEFERELAQQVQRIRLADVLAADRSDALAQVGLRALHVRDVLAGLERRHLVDWLVQ
jgi:hypothetical protein